MTKRLLTLAVAILIASATLLPVRAQDSESGSTITLSNIKYGLDPTDPTKMWTTTLFVVNRHPMAAQTANLFLQNAQGAFVNANIVDVNGHSAGTSVEAMGLHGIHPLSTWRFTVTAVDPSVIASTTGFVITNLTAISGNIPVTAAALVQETDANGKIVSSYEVVDPRTVSTSTGNSFVVPAVMGVGGSDTMLLLSNSSTATIQVTISVYSGIGYVSAQALVATTTLSLSPGMISQTVNQLFAGNASLQNFFLQPPPSGMTSPLNYSVVTVTSDSAFPFALGVTRANASPDGSVFQTPSNSFPLVQLPATQ